MRLFYIDHGLKSRSGHNWSMALGLREAFHAAGIVPHFLIHLNAIPELINELEATPAYPYSFYELGSKDPLSRGLEDMVFYGQGFAQGCQALDRFEVDENDIIFIPSMFQNELHGLIQWLSKRPRQKVPKLILNFMVENYRVSRHGDVDVLRAQVYRFCMKQLTQLVAPDRLIVTAQLSESVTRWQALLQIQVHELPLPIDTRLGLSEIHTEKYPLGEQTQVACLGMGRIEKGFAEIPAIVDQTLQQDMNVKFFIQVSPLGMEARWPQGWAQKQLNRRVAIWRGELSSDDYAKQFVAAHILLLNYQADAYAYRTSAIFEQARCLGRIIVAPSETWMGAQIEQGAAVGVTIKAPYSVKSACDALAIAAQQREALLAEAKDVAKQYQQVNRVQEFVKKLLELAQ